MQSETPSENSCTYGQESLEKDAQKHVLSKGFLFTGIVGKTLLPFVQKIFPDSHRFMQDNNLKHSQLYARDFIIEKGINWWKTPAESPDLNPIENLWHQLTQYKPKTKQNLSMTSRDSGKL